jgi:hypothetical protein
MSPHNFATSAKATSPSIQILLEIESAGEGLLRVVADMNEHDVGRPGWAGWMQLRIETREERRRRGMRLRPCEAGMEHGPKSSAQNEAPYR